MFNRQLIIKIAIGIALFASACSILKKEDPEKEIAAFLTAFQNTLTQPDPVILESFDARQSQESILSAIRILQNKENEFIVCTPSFQLAQILKEDAGIKVIVPVNFSSQNVEGDYHEETTLTLWLKPKKSSFVITKFEGEEFYKAFATMRSNMEWSVERLRELKKREAIYSKAKEIQQHYDSVIWYASYEKMNYFYVVNGSWNNYFVNDEPALKSKGYTMGLVDDTGAVIIPLEYDLIGTIGFDVPGLIEIKKDGKVGFFNLETKQFVVTPAYEMIIPYTADNSFALVKRDSSYGWIDHQYQYHEGFPSLSSEQWVKNFEFLPKNLMLKNDVRTLCEIPNESNAGYGIVMPPSYLVSTGVFSEIIGGISTTPMPINGWTESVETKGTFLKNVTDQINAVVTTITERYIDGREEFYTYNRMTLVNNKQDTLAVSDLYTSGNISFKKLNDSVLEVKYDQENAEGSEFAEYNMSTYTYFSLGADLSVKPTKSHRNFPQTQFVKLDSSYLSGDFTRWENDEEKKTSFLSLETVTHMRNEILADYGFRFADPEMEARFKYNNWYKPQYDKPEEFEELLTAEDRHNLDFLERIIALLKANPV
ncbi:YARHG domain-containing protein [Ohtaekwangia koreensis]|uniref:YARHG domain-containing protein n=1 Tax=Ohtaekwangia koreensis TaxID=688867 RepID=A0A1T5MGL7_9BACT|nr:YARHG domain-containing protein [Ohtaekwangia koreensis]SKC87213.1 YARHG domain-containing protein [Ohtaekwangia koreensis]